MTASSPELEAAADAYRKHNYVSAAAQLKVLAEQGCSATIKTFG